MKMEVFQPIPVLPSNAPPWTGVEDDESSQLQVLQEQCGNRQLGFLPSQRSASAYTGEDGSSPDEDFARGGILDSQQSGRGAISSYAPSHMSGYAYASVANENIYASVPSVKHGYLSHRPQGQRHRRPGETTHARDERKRDAQSRRLAALFSQCEGYLKYRNRQPKEGKGASKDQKWPDHMEDAFLRGCSPFYSFSLSMGRTEADWATYSTCTLSSRWTKKANAPAWRETDGQKRAHC